MPSGTYEIIAMGLHKTLCMLFFFFCAFFIVQTFNSEYLKEKILNNQNETEAEITVFNYFSLIITFVTIWLVKQLVKKLNPGCNIQVENIFSVLLFDNIIQLQVKVVSLVIVKVLCSYFISVLKMYRFLHVVLLPLLYNYTGILL